MTKKKPASAPDRSPSSAAREHPEAIPVVGVVAGPDGLDRFGELLSQLPADTGMAYVLLLPEEVPADPAPLAERTTMPVVPAVPGKRPRANHVYVAPASVLPVLRKRLFREDRIQQ